MPLRFTMPAALLVVAITTAAAAMEHSGATYLPSAADAKIVSVTPEGPAEAGITVLTQAIAIKESGPKETVDRFGEVYAFAPSVIIVHRDEPTAITFWNLQPDDEHDFMLADARGHVLMHQSLPALKGFMVNSRLGAGPVQRS